MFEALIGIGIVAACNLLAFVYGYGKLKQKVDDACDRLERVEDILNGKRK